MIDRSLNYGRPLIRRWLEAARPFGVVLDIGAGGGMDLASAAAAEPSARRLAIEAWPPNVERLRAAGVEVFALDLERDALPFDDRSIDVVIANQILEHTKEIFWIFHEVARVLRPGGRLIIGVPNLASLHNRLLLLAGRQPSVIKSASAHVRGYTRADLQHFVHTVAPGTFRLVASGGSNFYPLPPALARPAARLFPGLAWGLFLQFEKTGSYEGQFLDFPAAARLETNFRTCPAREPAPGSGRPSGAVAAWPDSALPKARVAR